MILNGFQKIVFQNRYVELEIPPPLHGKKHLKFPFWLYDYLPKIALSTWPSTTYMNCWLITSSSPLTKHWGWNTHKNRVHHTFVCLKILKNICSLCVFGLLQIFFQLSNTCHRRMSWKTAPGERLTSAPRLFRTFASHKSHEDVSGWIILSLRWAKMTPKDVLYLY